MKVSVIVNTYNNEKTIERCLDSVASQTLGDFECIIVDDCSLDHVCEICEKYVQNDNRFILVLNEKNLGCSLSRKQGLEYSQGKYLSFIDADDWLESDFLEKLVNMADAEDADLVYCDYYEEDGTGSKIMRQNVDQKTKAQIIT